MRYKELTTYLARMFNTLLGEQALDFGFSEDPTRRIIVQRQNGTPLPDASTILTFRIDGYDNWRVQRYGRGTICYLPDGTEYISELRTFKCTVNIMSKNMGDSFDCARFIIANLQNNRYNEFVTNNGRAFGIERISSLRNLSDIENATWTERVNFEIQLNFRENILVNDPTLFVRKPDTPGELPQSVEIHTKLKN